jgi:hypothetical protein
MTFGSGELITNPEESVQMKRYLWWLASAALLGSCGGVANLPFQLEVGPSIVQGLVPGIPSMLLVTVEDEGDGDGGRVEISARADRGQVTVDPTSIRAGEVAEVILVADPLSGDEIPIELTVTATRGSVVREHKLTTVVMPWEDTEASTASDILAVFIPWLAETHPDLGITPAVDFDGVLVAPRLLVVTHRAFFNDEWEIGLAWHIMVAPQDWAQIYLRPRDQMAPTKAFVLSSWSTALGGGRYEIREMPPPEEVVR